MIITLIISVVLIVAMWKIFTKAGKPGWHSIIPVLNLYDIGNIAWNKTMAIVFTVLGTLYGVVSSVVSTKLSNGESSGGLTAIMGILSIAFLVIYVMMMNKLSKSFGHGVGFTVGLVLLSPVFYMILGFGSSTYIGPEGNAVAGGSDNIEQQ